MIRTLYTGTTGVKNHILWLDVISNNVANVATIGYKKSRATFEDLLSQRLKLALGSTTERGGINPKQVGLGVTNASIEVLHQQASFEETEKDTDLAIKGQGFFVMSDGRSGTPFYTRAGGFDFDGEGYYVNPANGYLVQGWSGKFDEGAGKYYIDTSNPIGNIQIDFGSILPAKATENVTLKGNLDSQTPAAIDSIILTNGVTLRSISQARDDDGTSISLSAPVTSSDNKAGWTLPPDADSRIIINTYTSEPLSTYATIDELIGEINNSAAAGVTISYNPELDMFEVTNDVRQKGQPIFLGERDVTTRGFFTSVHIPTGTHDTEISSKIKFTRLLDAQHPDRYYYRWEAVDPTNGEAIPMVESAAISVMNTGPSGTSRVSNVQVQGLDITQPFSFAAFDLLPAGYGDSTISIYSSATGASYTSKKLSEYISVDEFMSEVNADFNAGATIRYDRANDRFILTNDSPGTVLSVTESTAGGGFISMAKFQRYADNTSNKAVLEATALPSRGIIQVDENGRVVESYNDTDDNGNNILDLTSEVPGDADLWSRTTVTRGIGLDYYRVTQGTMRESEILTSTQTVVNLNQNDADRSRVVVTVNNVFQDPLTYTFRDNTGPDGVDQIVFSTSPGRDAVVEVNYVREGMSAMKPADIFIPNGNEGPESITFSPNTYVANYSSYDKDSMPTMGIVEVVDNGDPATTVQKRPDEYIYSISREVFDSLGTVHDLTFVFERLSTNLWLWQVKNPSEDVNAPEGLLAGYGTLAFNADGSYNRDISQVFQSPSDPDTYDGDNGDAQIGRTMTIGYRGIYFDPPILGYPADYDGSPPPEHGASIVKIQPDFLSLLQQAHPSDANIYFQDGYGKGLLKEVGFNDEGILIGDFDNGQQQYLGQIALATFTNPGGLDKVSGTMFKQTANSGLPVVAAPGVGRNGMIVPQNLEMSNVQLADEFIRMIIAERAFQANSKSITTSDRMLQELIRLKQ